MRARIVDGSSGSTLCIYVLYEYDSYLNNYYSSSSMHTLARENII